MKFTTQLAACKYQADIKNGASTDAIYNISLSLLSHGSRSGALGIGRGTKMQAIVAALSHTVGRRINITP
jgi:hypothetical protein